MTDPNISLAFKNPHFDTPLEQQTAATNLMAQRQNVQSGALGIQQQKLDMSSDAAGRKLFSDALASGKDPSDNDILATYGAAKGTVILKNRMDAAKMGADLQDTRGKIAVQQSDYAGAGGKFIDAAGNDPVAFLQFANGAVRDKHIDPALAQPYIDHVTQLMQQDPTGAAAKEAVAKITASWMQRSSEQGKLKNERETAAARTLTAQTGADKWAAEKTGIVASSRSQAMKAGAQTLPAVKDQAGYDAWRQDNPEIAKMLPPTFSPAVPAMGQQLGMTADQQITTAQAAINAKETAFHNRNSEATARMSAEIAAGHLAQTQLVNGMKYGPGSQEYWVKQLQDNPDSIKEMPAEFRTTVGKQFRDATGLPLPTPLGAATQTQETAARNALDGIGFIRQAMQNPEIQKQIGPIMGRLGSAEQSVGTAVGLSPQAEALAQELRTRMRYFVFQEGKAILGGRLPAQLMKQLESSSASVKMDPAMMTGALDGAEGNAQNVMDNADRQRFGGKMRTREMRGQSAVAPTAPAGKISVTAPDGSVQPFSTQAQAEAFKKLAGIK